MTMNTVWSLVSSDRLMSSIVKTANILGYSRTTIYRSLERIANRRKIHVSGNSATRNPLLMKEVKGGQRRMAILGQTDRKTTI